MGATIEQKPLTSDGETIVDYLGRMKRKGAEKGDTGIRTTREVADYFGVSYSRARVHLRSLWDRNMIVCYEGAAGPRSCEWGAR